MQIWHVLNKRIGRGSQCKRVCRVAGVVVVGRSGRVGVGLSLHKIKHRWLALCVCVCVFMTAVVNRGPF